MNGSHHDRRTAPRVPIGEFVELSRGDTSDQAKAFASNLSRGGIGIAHCVLGEVGDRLDCRLLFTPREPLTIGCRIAWVSHATEKVPGGMGLEFEDLSETRAAQLDRLILRIGSASDEATPIAGLPIDPFCESGTWSPEAVSDTYDERLKSKGGGAPLLTVWVPPLAAMEKASSRFGWKTALLVAGGALLAALALGLALYSLY